MDCTVKPFTVNLLAFIFAGDRVTVADVSLDIEKSFSNVILTFTSAKSMSPKNTDAKVCIQTTKCKCLHL